MSAGVAARFLFRSAAATTSRASRVHVGLKPKESSSSSPFGVSKPSPVSQRIFRSHVELNSMLSVSPRSYNWTPQVGQCGQSIKVYSNCRDQITFVVVKNRRNKRFLVPIIESLLKMNEKSLGKPRILCLHGYRNSAKILEKLVEVWPENVLEKLELVYIDAPFPAQGKSGAEGLFDPPYYEWFQANEDITEFMNYEECVSYLEDYMVMHGPFDGLLGVSQGAILAATIPGMQRDGVALTKIPNIKFVILISGAKFGHSMLGGVPKLAANAFSSPIQCPSLHFIGEQDFMKDEALVLVEAFVDPVVIHHPEGHTVPRLDEESSETFLNFIEMVQNVGSDTNEKHHTLEEVN